MIDENKFESVVFGAGCFWCVEAIFLRVEGVESVVSGYSGGSLEDANYKAVCSGSTGHAEVCKISFDPNIVALKDLLKVFFETHDPTTLNRQGSDTGTRPHDAAVKAFRSVLRAAEAHPSY